MRKTVFKRSFIILIALLQFTFFPHGAFADTPTQEPIATPPAATVPADPTPIPTPTPTPPPVAVPTGAASKSYHFNNDTGLWENDYYTWNPATGKTAPKTAPTYSFNPASGKWETTQWRWDATQGKYVPNIISTSTPPSGSVIIPPAATGDPSSQTAPSANSLATPLNSGSNNYSNNDPYATGPDSSNHLNTSNTNNGLYDMFYNTNISNNIDSNAISGNVTVGGNTSAGNALSGDALTQATVLNMLQSVWSPASGNIATFTANINGDVNGDLLLDPANIAQNTSSCLCGTGGNNANNLTINATDNATLVNNINLNSTSGNVGVNKNTTAGDATSGTATAVANVVNLLNSVIGSGQSFVGTVNINGNLNGDILLPPAMLDALLASNVPRTTLSANQLNNSNILAEFNSNTNIANNVNANANSGSATASKNTTVGNVGSGNAETNVTILNLTGRQIVGSNALLVFVNVLGKWVGMIMDAPGATSAALGGGITNDSCTCNNNNTNNDATITGTDNRNITNNINVNAQSGNVDATKNTTVGNVKSGDTKAAANIANVSNSNLSLGGWFGVLFINVFGNWLGSFGVNTSAGDKPAEPTSATTAESAAPAAKVFQFVPREGGKVALANFNAAGTTGSGSNSNSEQSPAEQDVSTVLGEITNKPAYAGGVTIDSPNNIARVYLSLAFISLVIMSLGKIYGFLKARKLATAAIATNLTDISI